jgi:hypothetical protein
MTVFLQLFKSSFKECVREPIYFLLLSTALFLIGLFPTFSLFVFREQMKLVIDSAMATTLVFGLIASVLCASHTISREMGNGTVLLLLSKPVPRWTFIAAKITGILAALSVFALICDSASFVSVMIAKDQFQLDYTAMYIYYGLLCGAALLGAARNYLSHASFASTAVLALSVAMPLFAIALYAVRGAPDDEGFVPPEQLIPALLLLFPAVWMMGSITAALATRLEMVANLSVCSALFLLGLVSKYLAMQWFGGAGFLSAALCSFLPNWQYFWMADALASKERIPFEYVFESFFYSLLYVGVWAVWAMALFKDREVAGRIRQ